jgi:alkylation response protein AidB-like acyl-CoA dehydrogenase
MDFEPTEEQQAIRRMVRDFTEKEIAPRAEEIDETGEFPEDLFRRMGELGLLSLPFPERYGGSGGETTSLVIALEEVARVSGSLAIILDAHTSLCCEPSTCSAPRNRSASTWCPWPGGRRSAPSA